MIVPSVPTYIPFGNKFNGWCPSSPDLANVQMNEQQISGVPLDMNCLVHDVRAMPTHNTGRSCPLEGHASFLSPFTDSGYAENASTGCDSRLHPDFEVPQRWKHLSNSAHDEVMCRSTKSTSAMQNAWLADQDHPSQEISGSGAYGVMPTERGIYTFDAKALVPNSVDEHDHSGVGFYQANAHLDHSSRPVVELMVCNLPCKLSEQGLGEMVDELGFGGLYFRTYVPRGKKNNMGYGFVRFFDPWAAESFAAAVCTYRFARSMKKPYCKVATNQTSRPLYL